MGGEVPAPDDVKVYAVPPVVHEMTSCIVTMFFNLAGTAHASRATRPLEFYMNHGRPTLELPHPMVVFCDEDTQPLLAAIRGDRPTTYIVKSIFEYEHVKAWLPIVQATRASKSYDDPRNTPSHFMVTSFKPMALHLAKKAVPVDTYLWLDLGASHIARGFPDAVDRILAAPRPKIGLCYIHYRPTHELYPMKRYLATGGPCGLAGTAFTVAADYVDRFFLSMMSVAFEQVAEGVGHTEEQAMIYVYDRHPEWFSLYFGDYQSTLTNYHRAVEDLHIIEGCFRQRAQAEGRGDLVQHVLEHAAGVVRHDRPDTTGSAPPSAPNS